MFVEFFYLKEEKINLRQKTILNKENNQMLSNLRSKQNYSHLPVYYIITNGVLVQVFFK